MNKTAAFQARKWAIIIVYLLTGSVFAQTQPGSARQVVVVKGTIDSSYRPRSGVIIAAKRSGKSTRTNANGKFELPVLPTDTLTFRYGNLPVRTYSFFQLTGDVYFSFDIAYGTGQHVSIVNNKGDDKPIDENELPRFPWPVPQPSAKYVLEDTYFASARTLSTIDRQLLAALKKCQYPSPSYYFIPNGFAMVSQIEQIESDGTPKADPADRWSLQVQPLRTFNLSNYLRLLFTSATGRFRVVVFLVSNVTSQSAPLKPDIETVEAWLNRGGNFLPNTIGKRPYGRDYHVTALIYEFLKPENGQARPVTSSATSGQTHLAKSNFIANLSR